jgi:hypothetical protein
MMSKVIKVAMTNLANLTRSQAAAGIARISSATAVKLAGVYAETEIAVMAHGAEHGDMMLVNQFMAGAKAFGRKGRATRIAKSMFAGAWEFDAKAGTFKKAKDGSAAFKSLRKTVTHETLGDMPRYEQKLIALLEREDATGSEKKAKAYDFTQAVAAFISAAEKKGNKSRAQILAGVKKGLG